VPFVRRESFLKDPDNWTDVVVLDHVSVPLTRLSARLGLTPTQITILSIIVRLVAIGFFIHQRLVVGALFYLVGIVFDGVDGKLARLTARSSTMGAALDYSSDFGIFAAATMALGTTAGAPIWLIASCAGFGVASALAESPDPRNISPSSEWATWLAKRRLRPLPGVLELHVALFVLAPLTTHRVVTSLLVVATVYFAATWVLKLKLGKTSSGATQ
jgi:phosphatidylglycerophosphate synthase